MTLGLFMGFFGPALVPILVFLLSSFAIFLILASITYNLFMDLVPSRWVIYVCAGSFFVFSLVTAFFLSRLKQFCCKSKAKNTTPESIEEPDDPVPKLQILLTKCQNIYWGVVFIAACTGVLLGHLIATSFLISTPEIFWMVLPGSAVLLTLLTFKFEKMVIRFISAFVGSYCIVRGISFYVFIFFEIQAFPNELTFHTKLQ